MIIENKELVISCTEDISADIFNNFSKKVISEFGRIYDWFNIEKCDPLKLTLVLKADLDKIVKIKSEQYKNDDVSSWLIGFSNFEEVWVVIPSEKTLDELCKVALHELTHLLSYKLNTANKRLKILDEGIAVYLSNQYEGNILTPWVNLYLKNSLPKVSDFCTYDGLEFAKINRIQTFSYDNRIYHKHIWKRYFY